MPLKVFIHKPEDFHGELVTVYQGVRSRTFENGFSVRFPYQYDRSDIAPAMTDVFNALARDKDDFTATMIVPSQLCGSKLVDDVIKSITETGSLKNGKLIVFNMGSEPASPEMFDSFFDGKTEFVGNELEQEFEERTGLLAVLVPGVFRNEIILDPPNRVRERG